jgi:hypothetical protein
MHSKWWLMVAGRFILLLIISSLDPVLNENQGWQIDNGSSPLAGLFGFLPLIAIILAAWLGGRYALLTSAFTSTVCTVSFWYLQVPHIYHAEEQLVGNCIINGMTALVVGTVFTAVKLGLLKKSVQQAPEDLEYAPDVWPPAPGKDRGLQSTVEVHLDEPLSHN